MSLDQVRDTMRALLEDSTRGLRAKTIALAAGDPSIITNFQFAGGATAGRMKTATQVNVTLQSVGWRPDAKNDGRPHRDAFATIDTIVELFGVDPAALEDNVALLCTAFAQVVDELVAFSASTGGPIADVDDPIDYTIGEFPGPVTSYGFRARVTVFERSAQ